MWCATHTLHPPWRHGSNEPKCVKGNVIGSWKCMCTCRGRAELQRGQCSLEIWRLCHLLIIKVMGPFYHQLADQSPFLLPSSLDPWAQPPAGTSMKAPEGQLYGLQPVQSHRAPTQKDFALDFMLHYCHLNIPNTFILDLVFCKWNPMGQWSMSMSRGDIRVHVGLHHSIPPLHIYHWQWPSIEFQRSDDAREASVTLLHDD